MKYVFLTRKSKLVIWQIFIKIEFFDKYWAFDPVWETCLLTFFWKVAFLKVISWGSIINEGKESKSRRGREGRWQKRAAEKYSSPGDFLPTKASSALHISHAVTTLIFSVHISWIFYSEPNVAEVCFVRYEIFFPLSWKWWKLFGRAEKTGWNRGKRR